ncbi:MAG: hypothetical protein PHX78_05915 [bacterium]|nr:hypothetical protein [bacterium]
MNKLIKYFESIPACLKHEEKYPVKDLLIWMFKNGEIKKRLLITFGILVVSWILSSIPLPGIDLVVFQSFYKGTINGNSIIAMFMGTYRRMSICSVGLMPLINSCLIIQILSSVIPPLRKLSFGGETGRERISKYTYILTIILTVIQTYYITLWLESLKSSAGNIVQNPGLGFKIVCIITVLASVMFMLFTANLINQFGIGNGFVLILLFPLIIENVSHGLLWPLKKTNYTDNITMLRIIFFIASIIITYGMFYFTRMAKSIKIKRENFAAISILFRPTFIGGMPVLLASTILTRSDMLTSFLKNNPIQIEYNSISWIIFKCILVFVLTYVYILVVFSSDSLQKQMGKYGYDLVDNENKPADDYFLEILSKVMFATAMFLIILNLIPDISRKIFTQFYLGISVFSIFVIIFSDTLDQLIFYKDKENSGTKDWSICYTAFDEIDAEIKKGYLRDKGFPALVKPYRYSWGMPIRTIIDQYQIYVPSEMKDNARNLII